MKNAVTAILCLFATMATAQTLSLNETDPFTGEVKKRTKYEKIGAANGEYLYTAAIRVDNDYAIEFWSTHDQGCGGAVGNYTILLYPDGTTLELREDIAKIDCQDRASSFFLINPDEVKGVSKIRFRQSEGYVDYEVTGDYTLPELFQALQ